MTTFIASQTASTVTFTQSASTVTFTQVFSASTITLTGTTTRAITTTATATVTTTNLGRVPAPSGCGNQGLEYAVVTNTATAPGPAGTWPSYDPEYAKTARPIYYNATTPSFGDPGLACDGNGQAVIYGNPTRFSCNSYTVNHRGYFYTYATGNWAFSFSNVDDIAVLWIGQKAYTGWTRANLDTSAYYSLPSSVTLSLEQATYYPIRILFAQAAGGAAFQLAISDPSGTVAFTFQSVSPYFVQYSCDGISAPRYNELFGAET